MGQGAGKTLAICTRHFAAGAGLLWLLPACAQDPTSSLFDLDLEELMQIEVTVQRRAENILEVPIATTVIAGEHLAMLGASGEDSRLLSSRQPSLQVESSFGRTFPRFYLRGIGNTSFDLYASQPVSLLYDEVLLESPMLKGFPLFDLEQLEVARGPQGTLFGRNTPAGVVKLTSVSPGNAFGGFARVGLGRFQARNVEAAVGGSLGGDWSTRLSLLHQQRDNWVRNGFAGPEPGFEGYRDTAMRWQLRYEGADGIESLFKLHGRILDGNSRLFRANIIEPGSHRFAADFRPELAFQDGRNRQELEHYGASLRLRWPTTYFDLHAITALETADVFSRGDIDGGFGSLDSPPSGPGSIPFDSETAAGLPRHAQFTQELRLASNQPGPLDWQAGLFWFDEEQKVENFNFSSINGGFQNGYSVIRQDNQAWAVFGKLGFDHSERLRLQTGLRYTKDRKQFSAERPQTPGGGEPLLPITDNLDGSHLSWDLSAMWRLDPQRNLYVRLAEGFRAPSAQGRVMFSNEISTAEAETVLSLDLGIKGQSTDRRLRYALGIYGYRLDSPQLTAVGGSGNVARLLNAERAEGYGVELDVDARIGKGWSVSAGMSYNHTAIRDPDLLVRVCGAPCTVLDPVVVVEGATLARIDGNPLPYAPRWIGQLNLRYETPIRAGVGYLQSDWAWRSGMGFFLYESSEFRARSLIEGGLRIGFSWNEGHRDLAVFVRNLADRTALIGGIDFNNLTGMINEPRTWGIELRYGF
jgi:iron complex outermembrane receptor protein